jgi:hypothetical protein
VPTPLTPAQLRAAAEDARREAKRERAEAELRALALEQLAAELDDAAARGLSIDRKRVIVRHKMQAAAARPVRQLGRPAEVKHAFRAHLQRIGWDVAAWARTNGESPSTVKAWMRPDGGRKIPAARAQQIQDEAGRDERGNWYVPATSATWRAGIK